MKEKFADFAAWIMNVGMAINEWEYHNSKQYTSTDIELEINLLSVLFHEGKTPEEAVAFLTTESLRQLSTKSDRNIVLLGLICSTCKKSDYTLHAAIVRRPEGDLTLITDDESTTKEFCLESLGMIITAIDGFEQVEMRLRKN